MNEQAQRFSVKHWDGLELLHAASMSVGQCTETDLVMIGIDLLAQDGAVFAHGHFDIETAKLFHQEMGRAIKQALS